MFPCSVDIHGIVSTHVESIVCLTRCDELGCGTSVGVGMITDEER